MRAEHEERAPLLVLGLGNLLLGDDGAGLALLEELRRERGHAAQLEFVDGGTQGLALLGLVEGRRALLVLDAVALHAPPGSVHHLRDPLRQAAEAGSTAHESSASSLLAAARLLDVLPERVEIVGIEPGELSTRIGLSRAVREALPRARERAEGVLDEWCANLRRGELACTS